MPESWAWGLTCPTGVTVLMRRRQPLRKTFLKALPRDPQVSNTRASLHGPEDGVQAVLTHQLALLRVRVWEVTSSVMGQ